MKQIETAEQLLELCFLMPSIPVFGNIYIGGMMPINIRYLTR